MPHQLPQLPYGYDALEPFIDKETMTLHHDKHHATYVANLNAAIEKHPELEGRSTEDLLADLNAVPEDIRTTVRNNGGGHANHSMFWTVMGPAKGGEPSGAIADAIKQTFGDFETFKKQFNEAGAKQFGSGWVLSSCAALRMTVGSATLTHRMHRDGLRGEEWRFCTMANTAGRKRVLVTGAAGYIAGINLPALRERYDLVLLDARAASRAGAMVEGVTIYDLMVDAANGYHPSDRLRQLFDGVDAVFHCAYVHSDHFALDGYEQERANVDLAYLIYRLAYDAVVRRVVVCSSNHAADWYEGPLRAGRMDLLGPGDPPYSVSYTHLTLPTNREV